MLASRGAGFVPLLATACLAACSASSARPAATTPPVHQAAAPVPGPGQAPAPPVAAASGLHLDLPPSTSPAVVDDLARLESIRDERLHGSAGLETPIGPGDVLEISVPAMPELRSVTVRVSNDGNVTLPLLGEIHVAGLDEDELTERLRERLRGYMYNPQLSLLVKEYRSRQVGVLGAVAKPGLHTMATPNDTILDMISAAGGLTPEATQRILFLPVEHAPAGATMAGVPALAASTVSQPGVAANAAAAPSGAAPAATRSAAAASAGPSPALPRADVRRGAPLLSGQPSGPLLQAADPLVLNLDEMDPRAQQVALAVPVRPGDTIVALGGGQVFVEGWVERPGAYRLTRGLTLLGVVAASGGLLYPADRSEVRILREARPGGKTVIVADLEGISRAEVEDVSLREGDVVQVGSTGGKLAAYGVYQFFTNVIRVGASLPLF